MLKTHRFGLVIGDEAACSIRHQSNVASGARRTSSTLFVVRCEGRAIQPSSEIRPMMEQEEHISMSYRPNLPNTYTSEQRAAK